MALQIENDAEREKRPRCQGEVYSAFSGKITVGAIIEVMEWHLIERQWIEKQSYWAWGMSVTISSRRAPQDLPHGGGADTLAEAVEKLNEAWDLWVQYLGLAKAGTNG
jgi:hypothetical protein